MAEHDFVVLQNSSTCLDVDKESTVLGMMHPLVVEEPASEGLAIVSILIPFGSYPF